ncbi:DUF6575 domain-containing protein [Shewanella algae]|uniref:DUF6575 domain-containing protein n=1 Tax=Shewanella algae TaxID=38313 RepID=UPI00313C7774
MNTANDRSDLLFIVSERFGELFYHNVYAFYDEPLTFTALNEFGQLFFCYSLGYADEFDKWIVIPTSSERVNKLEQKDISIVEMIKPNASAKAYLIEINVSDFSLKENLIKVSKLQYSLPDKNVFISSNINYDGVRRHTHKIRIDQKSGKLESSTLAQSLDYFVDFISTYLKKYDVSVSMLAHDAIVGSFSYRIKTKIEEDKSNLALTPLFELSSKEKFLHFIDDKKIDLRLVRRLFDIILSKSITLEIIDENSTDIIFALTPEFVNSVVPKVDDMLGVYLDSTMVPQADSLKTIKSYIDLLNNKEQVTDITLGVTPRQVSYYRDACKLLNLIYDYSLLTPIGFMAAEKQSDANFINTIAKQFELSDCGFLWMKTQEVSSIYEVDENTAADFLIEYCNGLSENTARRRAQTLKSWVKEFKSFKP